jgi:hypothetical protein
MVSGHHRTNLYDFSLEGNLGKSECLRGLLRRHRLHVEEFPDVAVQVLKSMGVHEPIVLRIIVGAAASGDRLSHQLINLRLAFTGQRDENFRAPGSVADFFRREFLELGVRKQHDVDVRAHNHASGCFISELRIERKAKALEEVHGLAEILDWQINEYLRSHFWVCCRSVESLCEVDVNGGGSWRSTGAMSFV